jgi:DNA-binding transcriptional regulator YdaS (Cro superfamily)
MLIFQIDIRRLRGVENIRIAIDKLGGPTAAARALDCSLQAVLFWRDGKRTFPAKLCPVVERLTGVPCEALRPDIEWGVLRCRVEESKAM